MAGVFSDAAKAYYIALGRQGRGGGRLRDRTAAQKQAERDRAKWFAAAAGTKLKPQPKQKPKHEQTMRGKNPNVHGAGQVPNRGGRPNNQGGGKPGNDKQQYIKAAQRYAAKQFANQAQQYQQKIDFQRQNLGQEGGGIDDWLRDIWEFEGYDPADMATAKQALATESSNYDPNAINLTDSNAAKGTPSIGPAQVIGPTFEAHKNPGWDIYNPRQNIATGLRYARGRYGGNWLKAILYGSDLRPGGSTGY